VWDCDKFIKSLYLSKNYFFDLAVEFSDEHIKDSIDIMWEDLIEKKKQGPEFAVCGSRSRHLNS